MSVYHKADPGELIQWVTHESRSSAASNSGLIRIGTQPRTADAWHHDSCRPRGVVTRDFSAIFDRLFDRLPVRISTSDLHHWILRKKIFHIRAYDFGVQFSFNCSTPGSNFRWLNKRHSTSASLRNSLQKPGKMKNTSFMLNPPRNERKFALQASIDLIRNYGPGTRDGASGFDRAAPGRWPAAVSYSKSSIGSDVMHRWRTNKKTNQGLVPLPIRKDFLLRVVMI